VKVHINRLRVFFFFLNDFILLFSNDEIMATNFNKFQHGIRNSVVVVVALLVLNVCGRFLLSKVQLETFSLYCSHFKGSEKPVIWK